MLKILLKKQLAEIFRSYFYDAKKNKARSKGAVIAYMVSFVVLMAGLLGGMFTALSVSLCTPLVSAGMGWLYFAIMGLIAVVLGVFGSVFNTYAGLYLAKDNDLLLSMPIPVGAIMASRILGVYIMGLMYSGIVIIPAAVVYMIQAASAAAEFIGPVLLAVLISVLVLTLSCALGWVVAQISKKLKNRSFITVIISLLFLGAYYFIYFRAQSVITDIIANAAEYGDKIRGAAYPVYLFGNAGAGDPVSMLILTAVVAVLFALMWMLISRSFIKIATATGSTGKKVPRAKRAGRKRFRASFKGIRALHLKSELYAELRSRHGSASGIRNFPAHQGRGICRAVQTGVCRSFRLCSGDPDICRLCRCVHERHIGSVGVS